MRISEDLIKCGISFVGGVIGGFMAGFSLGENYAKDEIAERAEKAIAERESEVEDDPEVIVRFPSKRQEIEEPVEAEEDLLTKVDSEEDQSVVEKPEEAEDKEDE